MTPVLMAAAIMTMFFFAGLLFLFLPFAIFGIKPILRQILDEQKKISAALNEISSHLKSSKEPASPETPQKEVEAQIP